MREVCKLISLFLAGGTAYACLELGYRGGTHWTMFVIGGVLFLLIGGLNEGLPWQLPLLFQAVLGAVLVTLTELGAGVVLNLWLGLGIWDYTGLPCNVLGQICLPYTLLWAALSAAAVVLDDWLRHWMWGEPLPRYQLWFRPRRRGEVARQRKKW